MDETRIDDSARYAFIDALAEARKTGNWAAFRTLLAVPEPDDFTKSIDPVPELMQLTDTDIAEAHKILDGAISKATK